MDNRIKMLICLPDNKLWYTYVNIFNNNNITIVYEGLEPQHLFYYEYE